MLTDVVAILEAKDVGEEQARIVTLRFNQDEIRIGMRVVVLFEAGPLAGVNNRPESLGEDGGEPPVGEGRSVAVRMLFEQSVCVLLKLDIDGHDGVNTEEQVGPGIEANACVYGPAGHAVNVIVAVNLDGCV